MDYYKKTEKLLYCYPVLKKHLIINKLDLDDVKTEGEADRSKSIVISRADAAPRRTLPLTREEAVERRTKPITLQINKTQSLLKKIDAAISFSCGDIEKNFIRLKYFDNTQMDSICETLKISRSKAFRMKNTIIDSISAILFGADALIF